MLIPSGPMAVDDLANFHVVVQGVAEKFGFHV